MLDKIESALAEKRDVGLLLLRGTLGVVFLLHGYAIAAQYTPAGLAQLFSAIGIPLPLISAWGVMLVHLAGGAMLLLGLWTRLNALIHAAVMAVATVKAHLAQGFFLTGIIVDASNGVAMAGGYEYALTLALASLALAFVGGGRLALKVPAIERERGVATASI